MARTPDFNPQMAEALVWQIIAILQRDLIANLSLANPAGVFADVASYHTAPQEIYESAPAILVEPVTTALLRDEQVALTSEHTFAVSAIVVGDGDTEDLARLSRDYARALVMSLGRAEDLSDYRESLPVVMPDGQTVNTLGASVIEVSIRSVNWALKGQQNQLFARQPVVELAIVGVEQ